MQYGTFLICRYGESRENQVSEERQGNLSLAGGSQCHHDMPHDFQLLSTLSTVRQRTADWGQCRHSFVWHTRSPPSANSLNTHCQLIQGRWARWIGLVATIDKLIMQWYAIVNVLPFQPHGWYFQRNNADWKAVHLASGVTFASWWILGLPYIKLCHALHVQTMK